MIEVIAATQKRQADFIDTALGSSLRRLRADSRLVPHIAFANKAGLPLIYNARIDAQSASDFLLFVHDDVWLDDYFIANRIIDGLQQFDVIGIAGNRRLVEGHVGWCFLNDKFEPDNLNLSGFVAHGRLPIAPISRFGPVPAACELLDGVLLATRRSVLKKASVRFDPAFDFHFYDLDFCRTARVAGLTLGTWPIAMTHNSAGSYGTAGWRRALTKYRSKWDPQQ